MHMASGGMSMGLVMALLAMLSVKAMAQSGCTNVLISMAPCLNYVTGSSSTPSSSCCSQLASVVRAQPQCLCAALNGGGASLGININQTLALALPGACNVKTPPVSLCNGINGTGMSPDGSPAASAEGLPGGSKADVPATGGSSSNGFNVNMPLQLVLFVLFMASSASTFSSI